EKQQVLGEATSIVGQTHSQPKASRFSVLSYCANLLMPVSYLLVLAVILFFANIGSRESLGSVFLPLGRGPIWCVAALSFGALVALHRFHVALTTISPSLLFILLKYTIPALFLTLLFVVFGWFEPYGAVMKAVLDSRSFAALVGGALAL